MVQLIYIGGFGRSGSTLLETLMATSPDVVACGETVASLQKWDDGRRCSCGRTASECPVWGALARAHGDRRGMRHEDLDAALLEVVAPTWRVMVDSSKTAWGAVWSPFRLRRRLGQDFRLVHLVRDPRAVCWSVAKDEIKRAKRDGRAPRLLRRGAKLAVGWNAANLACEAFGLFFPKQYLRLRYEDFAQAPQAVLTDAFRTLLPESPIEFDGNGGGDNRHQLFGNRLRLTSPSFADVRLDDAWVRELPASSRRLNTVLCGWLRRRYGYV